MKNKLYLAVGLLCVSLSAEAKVATKTIKGDVAKALYVSLALADLPKIGDGDNLSISVKKIDCDIHYSTEIDHVPEASCNVASKSAAAVPIVEALLKAGIDGKDRFQRSSAKASDVTCSVKAIGEEPYEAWECTLTADFYEN
jgi:hypothetical protein